MFSAVFRMVIAGFYLRISGTDPVRGVGGGVRGRSILAVYVC